MAPSQEEWDRLSEAERAEVVAALPAEVTYEEMSPPEGDRHLGAKMRALDALRGFFAKHRMTPRACVERGMSLVRERGER